ncbi:MAG: fatty acid desaturase [Thiolinea sp.]
MNPLSEAIAQTTFPPMSEVRKQLRINWYRCPIDRNVLRQLVQPDDRQGLILALGHMVLWLLTAFTTFFCFNAQIWPAFVLALICHGIVTSHFSAPHHELCHRTVFKTQRYNEFFLNFFSLIGWLNYRVYRFSHTYHHRYTLFPEGDREEVMPVEPSLKVLYLLQLFSMNITGGYQSRGIIPTLKNHIQLALNRFDRPFNSWGEELYVGHEEQQRLAANWSRIVLAFHGAVILTSLAIGQPVIALIISGGVFIANFHRYFIGVTMHCGLRSNTADFRKCTRSVKLDPLSGFLYWHMNWHLEHHMYAAVPCYNLKKLHQALESDMPKLRTVYSAWQEMRETWRRQQSDPDYEYDTPVPEPAGGKVDKDEALADSIGDLTKREFAGR